MSNIEINENQYPSTTSSEHPAAFGLSFAGYHSPLPPPSVLAEYKSINPEILTIILETTVKEQEHRHLTESREVAILEYSRQIEEKAVEGDFRFGGRGQWIACFLATFFLIILLVLAFLGMETAVCAGFAAGSLMALSKFFAPRFLEERQDDKEERTDS